MHVERVVESDPCIFMSLCRKFLGVSSFDFQCSAVLTDVWEFVPPGPLFGGFTRVVAFPAMF